MDWRDQAACRDADPDLWFPEPGQSTRPAKDICWTCPVREACLNDALDVGEAFGIRGGYSAKERRNMRAANQRQRCGPGSVAQCGTRAGYQRHIAQGTQPCSACRDATAVYARLRRGAA